MARLKIQDVDYLFDVLGNLKQRHDLSDSTNLKETYGYDTLNRLKTVDLSRQRHHSGHDTITKL